VFIAVQGKSNMILFESTLYQKTRLARSFSNVLRALGSKSLEPRGKRPLAPALPVGIDGSRCQIVTDASLPQFITNFQRTLPTCCPMNDETLCESLVGQEILGLERVQHIADKRARKAPQRELAVKLGARVLAACEYCDRLFADCLLRLVQASASSVAFASSTSSAAPLRGSSMSRSALSSSWAMAGFCLMNSRTLSRPWPIRSPL